MPKFIDTHPMKPFTGEELNKLQNAPPDEFGVTHHDIGQQDLLRAGRPEP
jgi:hypothetical protein